MRPFASFLHLLVAAGFVAVLVTSSPAASIFWGPATNISGDSDVSTIGTVVGAFNLGGNGVPDTTVNGVFFDGFAVSGSSATSGGFTFTAASPGFVNSNTAFGPASPPFSNLSASYQALLRSATVYTGNSFTLTISGLTVGTQYQFQWWDNDSRASSDRHTTATAGNSISLTSNPSGLAGGLGQFAVGQFVADATTQSIFFSNDGVGMINAFQLRIVPEPSTWALLGVGGMALLALRRRLSSR